jgi:hypothetical protein
MFLQCLPEGVLVELGIEMAVGRAAHIRQDFYVMIDQQLEKSVNRMPAMTDGVKVHDASG